MKRIRPAIALALLVTCLLFIAGLDFDPAAVAAAELRVGRAATQITPTQKTGGVKRVLDELRA